MESKKPRIRRISAAWLLALLPLLAPPASQTPAAGSPPPVAPSMAPRQIFSTGWPVFFLQNAGQVDSRVGYYARTADYTLWLAGGEMVFDVLLRPGAGRPESAEPPRRKVIRLGFPGANPRAAITGRDPASTRVNLFHGSDPASWRTGVPTAREVEYHGLYQGIDLKVRCRDTAIEYDWIVYPGADPTDIRIAVSGSGRAGLSGTGDLVIAYPGGRLLHRRPSAYQEIGGRRTAVRSGFRRLAPDLYGIQVGCYDRRRPLVIDPTVLSYSTFLGGDDNDSAQALAADTEGRVYVAGYTYSSDFPAVNAAAPRQADRDVFVARLKTGGSGAVSLEYATYLGGQDLDDGTGVAVDAGGRIYVCGYTFSSDFPTRNPYQTFQGGADAFLVRLDPSRSGAATLQYATCLGSSKNDLAFALALDAKGQACLTGYTTSPRFPVLNRVQPHKGDMDIFVARLNPDEEGAESLTYGTCLGGTSSDRGAAIAVTAEGKLMVAGSTRSADFPLCNPFSDYRGSWDAVLFELDPDLSGTRSLLFSTCLGGEKADYGTGIGVNPDDNTAYLCGYSESSDFPLLHQVQRLAGYTDAFLAHLDPVRGGADCLLYSTLLGGSGWDFATGMALDSRGLVYLTGYTDGRFPLRSPLQTFRGSWDAFVTRMNPALNGSASLYNSTCLGGRDMDYGRAIAVDGQGVVHVCGYTFSGSFPVKRAYQDEKTSNQEAFVSGLKFPSLLRMTLKSTAYGTTVPAPGVYEFAPGARTIIRAVPDANGVFTGWSGGARGKAKSIFVTMTASKVITARFIAKPRLTISAAAGGTTNPVPGLRYYTKGTTATVYAIPEETHYFTGWSGSASGTANPVALIMNGNRTLTAGFTPKPRLSLSATEGGAIDPPAGDHLFMPGTVVTLTAVPDASHTFTGWSGGVSDTANPLVLTVNGDLAIVASFALKSGVPR